MTFRKLEKTGKSTLLKYITIRKGNEVGTKKYPMTYKGKYPGHRKRKCPYKDRKERKT